MFRHVVIFRWNEDVSADTVATIAAHLGELPEQIPELRDYRVGNDAGLNADNFDFAVVADFDSSDGFIAYRDHPAHRAIADNEIIPNISGRAAVQFWTE